MRTSQKHPPIMGRVYGHFWEVVSFKNRSTGDPFLVMVLEAILTNRLLREKLKCLDENLMLNNFRETAVLKKK